MDQVENLLGAAALAVTNVVWEGVNRVEGTSDEDSAVLVMLGAQPMTVGKIAVATRRSPSATVRSIDRLVKIGLVERARDVADGRVVTVDLTEIGADHRERILSQRSEAISRIAGVLSPSERSALEPLLRKMLGGIVDSPAVSFQVCRLCDEDSCVPRGCPVESRYDELVRP